MLPNLEIIVDSYSFSLHAYSFYLQKWARHFDLLKQDCLSINAHSRSSVSQVGLLLNCIHHWAMPDENVYICLRWIVKSMDFKTLNSFCFVYLLCSIIYNWLSCYFMWALFPFFTKMSLILHFSFYTHFMQDADNLLVLKL